MIRGPQGIRQAYRDDKVAREYVAQRFIEPLGAMLHARQVQGVRDVIRTLQPTDVLEIAPGPARLTLPLSDDLPRGGTLVDASAQMLREAGKRLAAVNHRGWRLVQGDAFQLPFRGSFDLVYTFRFIRHFESPERARIYRQLAALVRPGGRLVFDAVNEKVARAVRARPDGSHQHYDALLSKSEIIDELAVAGFHRVHFADVQRWFPLLYQLQVLVSPRSRWLAAQAMEIVDRLPGGEPLEWIVTCERT